MDKYEEHLKKPINVQNPDGSMSSSEPKETHRTMLGGSEWIDSTHSDSEVKGYFTRYLATIKDDIGVLITYSIQKQKMGTYAKVLEDSMRTIRVHREKPATVASAAPSTAPAAATMPGVDVGAAGKPVTPTVFNKDAPETAKRESSTGAASGGLGLLVLLAAGGGFFYYKKKKAGG